MCAQVPRDIIDRNLRKASEKGQADYAEVRLMWRSPCVRLTDTSAMCTSQLGSLNNVQACQRCFLPRWETRPCWAVNTEAWSAAQVTYEAYGAGGTGFIMECLTDNVNRCITTSLLTTCPRQRRCMPMLWRAPDHTEVAWKAAF